MPSLDSDNDKLKEYVRIKVSMFRQNLEDQWTRPGDEAATYALLAAETLVALQHCEVQFAETICLAHIYIQENFGSSSVSQREIQRVFRFMDFFLSMASRLPSTSSSDPMSVFETAMYMSVALVYYFRLSNLQEAEPNVPCRLNFSKLLGVSLGHNKDFFSNFVDDYVQSFVSEDHFVIPPGVAPNKALSENIFTIVCCVETRVPLGIIGEVSSMTRDGFKDGPIHQPTHNTFCSSLYVSRDSRGPARPWPSISSSTTFVDQIPPRRSVGNSLL